MNREFKDALEDSPVIAAIKDDNGLKECLKSDIQVVFILYGDICNIADFVRRQVNIRRMKQNVLQ